MRFTRGHSRSGNCTPILACSDYANFHVAVLIALIGALALFCGATRAAHGASSESSPVQNVEVTIFAAPDELSAVVERTREGESLSPMGEMIGPGGLKWFMVKTRTGNVGWIKATDNTTSRKIDGHFRSLPNEVTTIEPASTSASISSKTSAKGAITVPVKVVRAKVTVPVTFNNSVTSYLAIDTGDDKLRLPGIIYVSSQRGSNVNCSKLSRDARPANDKDVWILYRKLWEWPCPLALQKISRRQIA